MENDMTTIAMNEKCILNKESVLYTSVKKLKVKNNYQCAIKETLKKVLESI